MPPGTVDFTTLASSSPADENAFLTFMVDKKWLKPGENILAAEIHQISAGSSDVSFDAKLLLKGKTDQNTTVTTNPEIVLNMSSSTDCRAFFDEEPCIASYLYQRILCEEFSYTRRTG